MNDAIKISPMLTIYKRYIVSVQLEFVCSYPPDKEIPPSRILVLQMASGIKYYVNAPEDIDRVLAEIDAAPNKNN